MGRRKIQIARIEDERNRSVTFNKRRAGLFKKAYELGVLCGADVAVIVFSAADKCYEYSSANLDETLLRYSRMTIPPAERKGPSDFGGVPSPEVGRAPRPAKRRRTAGKAAPDADDDGDDDDESDTGSADPPAYARPEGNTSRSSQRHPALPTPYGTAYLPLAAQLAPSHDAPYMSFATPGLGPHVYAGPPVDVSGATAYDSASHDKSQAAVRLADGQASAQGLDAFASMHAAGIIHAKSQSHRHGSAPPASEPELGRSWFDPSRANAPYANSGALGFARLPYRPDTEGETFEWPSYDRFSADLRTTPADPQVTAGEPTPSRGH